MSSHTSTPIKVCVFCGASDGRDDTHLQAARDLAKVFHSKNIQLVYGGGTHGVMGELAKSLVALSGPDSVHGIIPAALLDAERENVKDGKDVSAEDVIKREQYGRTIVVRSMHERKQMFVDEVQAGAPGSGFIAMSGGYGTLEELLEMMTWNQLNVHQLPVVVFNINGVYDGLFAMFDKIVQEGFVREGNRNIAVQATTAHEVVEKLETYTLASNRMNLTWNREQTWDDILQVQT